MLGFRGMHSVAVISKCSYPRLLQTCKF